MKNFRRYLMVLGTFSRWTPWGIKYLHLVVSKMFKEKLDSLTLAFLEVYLFSRYELRTLNYRLGKCGEVDH